MTQRVTFTHANLQQQSWKQLQGRLPLSSHHTGCSPFCWMASTLPTTKITTDSEEKGKLNSRVCYTFFLVISILLFRLTALYHTITALLLLATEPILSMSQGNGFWDKVCGKGNKDISQVAATIAHHPAEEVACLHSPSLPRITVGLCGCSLISFIRMRWSLTWSSW